eukprot:1116176-Rhodomonas_salina.1
MKRIFIILVLSAATREVSFYAVLMSSLAGCARNRSWLLQSGLVPGYPWYLWYPGTMTGTHWVRVRVRVR